MAFDTGTLAHGSIVVEYTCPDFDQSESYTALCTINSSTSDQIATRLTGANDRAAVLVRVGGAGTAFIENSSDIINGVRHKIGTSFDVDDVSFYVDGVFIGNDTDVPTIPTFDTIAIGSDTDGALQSRAIIHRVRLYKQKGVIK